mgnify:CR=1 FL=1
MTNISLEANLKSKIMMSKIQKIILNSLYAAGVLSMAVLAPNALSILKQFDRGKTRSTNPKYLVNNAINRLRKKGLVVWEETAHGVFLRLTAEGKRTIDTLEKNEFKLLKPKKWDGRWRIIIFDIRETRRGTRDKFRRTLSQIGFLKLQHSVWVYPYDCEELMALIKADFKVGKDILYIIADSIENDRWIRNYFGV